MLACRPGVRVFEFHRGREFLDVGLSSHVDLNIKWVPGRLVASKGCRRNIVKTTNGVRISVKHEEASLPNKTYGVDTGPLIFLQIIGVPS